MFKENELTNSDTTGIMQKPKQKQQQFRDPEAIQKSNRKAGMQFSAEDLLTMSKALDLSPKTIVKQKISRNH